MLICRFSRAHYPRIFRLQVNFNEINGLPEIAAALKRENVSTTADLYRIFLTKMHSYATARNKTLHVWEGFKPPPTSGYLDLGFDFCSCSRRAQLDAVPHKSWAVLLLASMLFIGC